ncbi:MAG TPA: hypothetical protein VI758_10525 [Bacteroidota bacterium]
MDTLSLDNFLSAGSDAESARYRILASLRHSRINFDHNRIYPDLTGLIELKKSLEGIVNGTSKFLDNVPQKLKDIDLVNKKLIFEPPDISCTPVDKVLELIHWALPLITEAIEEGRRIYDFVEENLAIKEVGIVPFYHDEGYWLVPDNRNSRLHVIRFSLALYESETEKFRTLKTTILKTLEQANIRMPVESIKMGLVEEHRELPNPATFVCETDLDFPFKETIFPVAKRKLMVRLAA